MAATLIRRHEALRQMWGTDETGEVADAWYVSNDNLHVLVYSMAPGGWFGSSDEVRTVFDADQLYYVLEGTLALADPATGEVQVIAPGDAAFVRSDTWTHGFAVGEDAVRVLELVSPGLQSAAAVAYTRAQPLPERVRYERRELRRRWPLARAEAAARSRIYALRAPELLWQLDDGGGALAGTWISTERSSVTMIELQPGQRTSLVTLDSDACAFGLVGSFGARVPDEGWFELAVEDALHLPPGTPHRFHGLGSEPSRLLLLLAASGASRAAAET